MGIKVEKRFGLGKQNEHNEPFNIESSATFDDLLAFNWHKQTLRKLTFNLIL